MIVLHLSHEEKLAILLLAFLLIAISVLLTICLASPFCLLNHWLGEWLRQRKINQHIIRQNQFQIQHPTNINRDNNSRNGSRSRSATIGPNFQQNATADNISAIIWAQSQAPPSYERAVELGCGREVPNGRIHFLHQNLQLVGKAHYPADKLYPKAGHDDPKDNGINYADYFHQPSARYTKSALDEASGGLRSPIPLIVGPKELQEGSGQAPTTKLAPVMLRFWLSTLEPNTTYQQNLNQNQNQINNVPINNSLQRFNNSQHLGTSGECLSCAQLGHHNHHLGGGFTTAAASSEDLSSMSSSQSSHSSGSSQLPRIFKHQNQNQNQNQNQQNQTTTNNIVSGHHSNGLLAAHEAASLSSHVITTSNKYSPELVESELGVSGHNIASYEFTNNSTTTNWTGSGSSVRPESPNGRGSCGGGKNKQQQMVRFKICLCDIENLTRYHLLSHRSFAGHEPNDTTTTQQQQIDHHNNNSNNNSIPFMLDQKHQQRQFQIYIQCDLMAPTRSRYLRPMMPMSSKMKDARPVVTFNSVSRRLSEQNPKPASSGWDSVNCDGVNGIGLQNQRIGGDGQQSPEEIIRHNHHPLNVVFVTPKLTHSLLQEGYIRMRIFMDNKYVNAVCVAQLKLPINNLIRWTQQQQQQQVPSNNTADGCCNSMSTNITSESLLPDYSHHMALSYECELLHEVKGKALVGLSYLPTSNRVIFNAYEASLADNDKDLKKLLLQTGNSYLLRFMMMINGRVIKKKRTPVVSARQNSANGQQNKNKLFWDSQESITFDLVNINVDQPDFVVALVLRQQYQHQLTPSNQNVRRPHNLNQDQNQNQPPVVLEQFNVASKAQEPPSSTTTSSLARRLMWASQLIGSKNSTQSTQTAQLGSSINHQAPNSSTLTSSASFGHFGNLKQLQMEQQRQQRIHRCSHNRLAYYASEPEYISANDGCGGGVGGVGSGGGSGQFNPRNLILNQLDSDHHQNHSNRSGPNNHQQSNQLNEVADWPQADNQIKSHDIVLAHAILSEPVWRQMKLQPRRQIKREFQLY